MKIDEKWIALYRAIYGEKFNRVLTIGTKKEGFKNYNVRSIDQLSEYIEEYYPQKEFYMSLYNFDTDENILKWDRLQKEKYEEHSKKRYIMFRFKNDTTIIRQETEELNEIQKYMFIRRSINLGHDKKAFYELQKVYDLIKSLFNIEAVPLYTGFNEFYLFINLDEDLELENPSLTMYYLHKFIEDYCELETLNYERVDVFSQIIVIPGTQDSQSRLYAKIYGRDTQYHELIEYASKKDLIETYKVPQNQDSSSLRVLLEILDGEISKRITDDEVDVRSFDLNELFQEVRQA